MIYPACLSSLFVSSGLEQAHLLLPEGKPEGKKEK